MTFSKRFSELNTIYLRLTREFPFLLLPAFPQKDLTMLYAEERHKIEQRAAQLQRFFRKLLSSSVVRSTNLIEFLTHEMPDDKKGGFRGLLSGVREKFFGKAERKKVWANQHTVRPGRVGGLCRAP